MSDISFKIKNYRGIKSAEFDTSKITAFFGDNGAGKSSIVGALRAVLSGEALKSTGLTKKDAYQLVNRSANGGESVAAAYVGDAFLETTWPDCTHKAEGVVKISNIGLGLKDPLDISQKEKDKFFCDLLNAIPSKDELYEEVRHIVPEDRFESIWNDIIANNWDTMSEHYHNQAKQKKGAWKHITGEVWGSAKATNWLPPNWTPNLETASKVQLQTAIAAAQEELESVAASNAIDDHKLSQLTALSEKEDLFERQLKDLETELENTIGELDSARKKMISIEMEIQKTSDSVDTVAHCPSCNVCLKMVDGKLEHSIELTPDEVEDNRKNLAKLNVQHGKGKAYVDGKERTIQRLEQQINSQRDKIQNAKEATEQVSEYKKTANQGLINKAREGLRIANENLAAWEKRSDAEKTSKAVNYYIEMSQTLSSSGLRKKILSSKIRDLNAQIEKSFPWEIKIDDALNFKFNGRPSAICCESEKWRISVVVQCLIATIQGDPIVIIDRADVLDNRQKNLFFKTLISMPFKTVVMLKADNKKDVLDLAKRKIGQSFWVNDGQIEAV